MKTLTSTLLAAQKSLHPLPYVEAKVYDYEQGIKRLAWTHIYEGTEPDNHHGIAFDGEGSMHRIRADGTSLYRQKVINPTVDSDFSIWTQIATNCAGPCAIAAYGSRVYIFYKTSTNVLWKYYSHDYGATWNNAQLSTFPDVLFLAAAWQGTTSTVVCAAAATALLNAIVLNTDTQAVTENTYAHALDEVYGIGMTYQGGEFPVVIGGKDTNDSIVTYSLYATNISNTYHFSTLRALITAQDDQSTIFKYPDCHVPSSPADYESLQITVLEVYSGTTAYSRPLLSHLVKDIDWLDPIVTEPKPFLNISPAYGLRLQSKSDFYWLSMPSGLWRAPRAASTPLDISADIVKLTLTQATQGTQATQPTLVIELDNSKGQYATPGAGALASLRFRAQIALKLGYKTTAGDEAVDAGHYWIDSWQYSIAQAAQPTLTLYCLDPWGLAAKWAARYVLRWNYTTFQPTTVWQILLQLMGRFGIRLWNNPSVTRSATMTGYYPKFIIRGGSHGHTQMQRLLAFATDGLIQREDYTFVRDLLANEASSYTYHSDPNTAHPIISGQYSTGLSATHVQVSGETEDEPPVPVRESAFDWVNLARGIENLVMQYDPNLEQPDQAKKRADALLRHEAQRSMGGQIAVPLNCGQELYDVITITDTRAPIASTKYRILALRADYDRRQARFQHTFTLGAPF